MFYFLFYFFLLPRLTERNIGFKKAVQIWDLQKHLRKDWKFMELHDQGFLQYWILKIMHIASLRFRSRNLELLL